MSSEPRDLTKKERAALDRLEKALAAIPDSLYLYFHPEGLYVYDPDDWLDLETTLDYEDRKLDERLIDCLYDTGAL